MKNVMNTSKKELFLIRDQLIERVGHAVKEVHLCISCPGGCKHYESCVAARLIYSLDNALQFGLKVGRYGYWPIVAKILPKSTLTFINQLSSVTTKIGKGRAWLLLSLNEGTLEGYLATLGAKSSLLSIFYHRHALLLSAATLQILITLVSGLEHVGFDFPIDVAYLNSTIVDDSFMKFVLDNDSVQSSVGEQTLTKENSPKDLQDINKTLANFVEQEVKMDSQQKTYSVMNSPLVKRRSHLRSTLGDSCHSLSNPKRVSFHENHSYSNLSTIKSVQPSNSKSPGLHRYKSEWMLGEDVQINEIKRVSSLQPRRFQSEMFLNYCDSAAKEGIEMERGVPEGQEDPQRFCSVLNLASTSNIHSLETASNSNNEMLIVKARMKQRPQSANLTKYALSLLSSMRSSIEQPKFQITLEQKQKYMKAARQKWLQPPLDLGLPQMVSLPAHCETFHDELLADLENMEATHDIDGHIALNIAQTLGLDVEDHYKVFRCYVDFLWGKPRATYLLLGTKALHVTFSQTHSLLWSATLFDIDQVTVRLNYSVLELKSIVSNIIVQFVNSDTLRTCACSLDIILRKVKGYETEWPIVSVETAYQLNNNWKSWLQEETKELYEQILYMGLVYWEETSLITNRESILGPYKAGYLMYRWSSSKKWHVGYFVIKAGVLYQFNHQTDRVPVFILALHGEQCKGYGRNFHSSRPHTVEIQMNNNKCLLFATASETEATDWLMILAQCAFIWEGTHMSLTEMSHSPVACAVVITKKNIMLLQCDSPIQPTNKRCLATTPLDAIPFVTVSPGRPDDTFCVIEFDCREASEGTGDWILYFQSETNREEFLTALRRPRQVLDLDALAILRNKNARLRHV